MPFFKNNKILTLPSLYIFEIAMFVKSNINKFNKFSDNNNLNTRNKNKYCRVKSNTTLMHNSVFCMAPKIYNKIPESIKGIEILCFKKKLKSFLVERCYYSITEFLNDDLKSVK